MGRKKQGQQIRRLEAAPRVGLRADAKPACAG
jgi:hypothetical protein